MKTIEHPTARQLREENALLKKSEARARRLYDEIKDEVLKLRKDGRKTPEEMKEKLEEKQNEIDRLELELDAANEKTDGILEDLEFLVKDIRDSIRSVETFIAGGHSAKYHEINPKDLLRVLKEWKKEVEEIISHLS